MLAEENQDVADDDHSNSMLGKLACEESAISLARDRDDFDLMDGDYDEALGIRKKGSYGV